jgi:hypothetical protein
MILDAVVNLLLNPVMQSPFCNNQLFSLLSLYHFNVLFLFLFLTLLCQKPELNTDLK